MITVELQKMYQLFDISGHNSLYNSVAFVLTQKFLNKMGRIMKNMVLKCLISLEIQLL